MVVLALRMVFSVQGQIGEALDEFHQAMRSAAEQQEIALICQYEIGEWVLKVLCGYNNMCQCFFLQTILETVIKSV